MMNTKVTKKEKYEAIIEAMETGSTSIAPEVLIDFCNAEIAALEKKAAKAREKAAEKRAVGDELTDTIKSVLTDEFEVISDITTKVVEIFGDEATKSKVTYRLGQLVENGFAEKADIKIAGGEGQKARTLKGYKRIG